LQADFKPPSAWEFLNVPSTFVNKDDRMTRRQRILTGAETGIRSSLCKLLAENIDGSHHPYYLLIRAVFAE